MKSSLPLLALLSLLCGCGEREPSQDSRPVPQEMTLDEDLLKVAQQVPGFGGMYIDEGGVLNVYMLEEPADAAAMLERRAQLEKTLSAVYGADFLARGRRERVNPDAEPTAAAPLAIKIVKGAFDIPQLADWRRKADGVLAIDGVVFTDLDERSNRLKVGIAPGAARGRVQQALKESGIPPDAVILEETKPVYQHATLRSKVRPVPGGVQIEADTGVFAFKICTMGFNAIRAGMAGFVTNSHCTKTQGGNEGTDFHQPDDPLFSGNPVGDEIVDPNYFTGGMCPAGRRCRFSDSAFVDYTVARGSNIARTEGWNNGSLTISSTPRLRIVAEMSSWADGSDLDKIGRTSGWAFGLVNGTCQNTNVAGTDITQLCQFRVNRLAGQTYTMSDNGDSGSPVFRWLGASSTVNLSGILWGGPDDGSAFVFSPMNQIEQELGPLTTFNFPQPQPPQGGQCPANQKCCEREIINGKPRCVLCVPRNAQCP